MNIELPAGLAVQGTIRIVPDPFILREHVLELITDAESFSTNPGGYEDRWDPAYSLLLEFLVPPDRTAIVGKQMRIGTLLHGQHPQDLTRSVPFKSSKKAKYLIPDIMVLIRFFLQEQTLRLRIHLPVGFVELKRALPRAETYESYPTTMQAVFKLLAVLGKAICQVESQATLGLKTMKQNYPSVPFRAFLMAGVGPWLAAGFADGGDDNTVEMISFLQEQAQARDAEEEDDDDAADETVTVDQNHIIFDRSLQVLLSNRVHFQWFPEILNLKEDRAWAILEIMQHDIRRNILNVFCQQRGEGLYANCWIL